MRINDFHNETYHELSENDYLICTIGYEERSAYLLEKNINTRNSENTLVVIFDDFEYDSWFNNTFDKLNELEIKNVECAYDQSEKYIKTVIRCINDCEQGVEIYIDYSSIPRTWYCGLMLEINRSNIINDIPVHFLYTAGNYPETYSACGIGSLSCFVGKMLPNLEPNKLHIIALGYDVERTQSLINLIEPNTLLACYAYTKLGSKEQIEKVNKDILDGVSAYVPLHLNDFRGMMDRLNELIIEQTRYGQVVIIPDGPKPLIFAMSMISIIHANTNREIICLHVSRNSHMVDDHKVRVKASELENDIYCVKYQRSEESNLGQLKN